MMRYFFKHCQIFPAFQPFPDRNIILIKGYQGKHGRCIEVLKAMIQLKDCVKTQEIVIFGANKEVIGFIKNTGYAS